jgi:thioredoxin-related protein
MNKSLLTVGAIATIAVICCAFVWKPTATEPTSKITWYTWEQAMELNEKEPRKIFVDVYTDWCGWCKRMDKSTFTDPAVAEYLSKNFYPVKFNAEQKEDITFNGKTMSYVGSPGSRGYHELAATLLDGRLGYPSFVYLNERFERIMISPGYKEPDAIMKELTFAAEEQYKNTTWEAYKNQK